jgi:hypothetical protein
MRLGICHALALAAQFLTGCASRNSQNPHVPQAAVGDGLPRAAYLVALDSSLARIGASGKRILIHGAEAGSRLTAEDLRIRKLTLSERPSVCPGEAALWFQRPERFENGQIRLDVVEATERSGLAGGRSYLFRCAAAACHLEGSDALNSDHLVGCQASAVSSSIPVLAA